MYHLIKKDILIQKKNLIFSLLYLVLFTILVTKNEIIGLTIAVLAVTYLLAHGASSLEDKNNSDIMLVSLPIKKRLIVLAKYISVYGYAAYAIIICYLMYVLAHTFNLPITLQPITTDGLLVVLFSVTLFGAISYPLIFKYGYTKSRTVNMILFFILIFTSTTLADSVNIDQLIQKWSESELILFSSLTLLFILALSYSISLAFYKKREF